MGTDLFRDKILILDGAMGTVLQQRGLPPGGQPELLNLTDPALLASVYQEYVEAGSQVVYANTFGANGLKLARSGHAVSEVIAAAVSTAKGAVAGRALTALDVGPLGELLEPMGSLTFERAYDLFREVMTAGAAAGADLVVIETMTDLYEARAALLAAKENTALPVLVTMSFEESGRTFTGCTVASMARTLEGLGADAIGLNCSLGPDQLAPLLRELCENTRLPVAAKPNAGLPDPVDGRYGMGPEEFAAALAPCLAAGVTIFGGCCGTSPAYIRRLKAALEGARPAPRRYQGGSFICTPVSPVRLDGVRVIGERVNPTGKKRFQQALLEEDLDYILDVAAAQEEAGADILDVNVGCPGVDETAMLPRVVKKLQSAVSLPLQLDSSDPDALEAALRVYNGKAAVNSVNGEPEALARVLPIVKKYGASVVGLTMDQDGIPQTAEKRVEIAKRILDAALACGIPREDVWIDCLALTVSAQQEQAGETLKAVRTVRRELGLQTVLGVSNISFGLPNRALVTQSFLTQALAAGLTLPIVNPNQQEMLDAVAAFRVLSGEDAQCRDYIARFAAAPVSRPAPAPGGTVPLEEAVARGLRADAARLAGELLQTEDGITLVERRLIPALDAVGEGYERGTVFLPQLLSAAQAAQAVFEAVRTSIAEKGGAPVKKGRLIVATVRGDIHDIGKNIVKTVLENYGYEVVDLGRDVPPETVAQAAADRDVGLVGLSALMTTTLPAMEETVRRLRALDNPPAVFVGGAVVTPEYAERIGAGYARDARQSVEIARRVLG
ncbi:homocysteine S-methyltransferase family protein [Oscillibacter sp. 1-3]|uniref:homocysteine S-methyltransferase family protein n=1 Tax=Oscillibacter sp. 1-3 TaxID=1235797 RepID=UPI000334B5B4|nr:homocysteine S-methyltransferase family protein [Oscillibacter sp. 1-3]EOS67337.1 methylmalonyl-CoA mutase domain-containing protein [Oscillibacter sp. 1-3]